MNVTIEKGLLGKWWVWNATTGQRMKMFRRKSLAKGYCFLMGYTII